jgi:8-hydroxy-5-deazaflavin:NADPH oxidoreductase
MTASQMHTIAVVGGTGPQGRGLAYRLARGGHDVVLGSREADRATAAADELAVRLDGRGSITGASNADACAKAEIVLLAVPYDGHDALVEQLREPLAGKIVISCVNPLGFDKQGPFGLDVAAGSAAEAAAALLPEAVVVGAFHHLSAVSLITDEELNEDVLVCADDRDAAEVVAGLALAVTGRPGIYAGRLRLARQLEPLTAVLISVNKVHKVHSGIQVTGLPRAV